MLPSLLLGTTLFRLVLNIATTRMILSADAASPEQAQEVHAFIRQQVTAAYSEEVAAAVSILYGGSVKHGNAAEIFSKPDVDGGLIGGASLVASDFLAIVRAFD